MKRLISVITPFLVLGVVFASEPTSGHRKAIKIAEELGRAIYEQDLAAASASDALLAATSPESRSGVLGWIVTGPKDAPLVQFIGKQGDAYVTLFDVPLHSGKAAEVRQLSPDRELPGDNLGMFLARQSALAALPLDACSKRYNTIVLPNKAADHRGWLVYLLAATTDADKVLVGGHYRAEVSADGTTVISTTPLSRSCLVLSTAAENGGTLKALVMSQVLTETPIETHVYLNLLHKIDFYVVTEPGIWGITDGSIRYAGPRPEPERE
jgi:hypothetical protein